MKTFKDLYHSELLNLFVDGDAKKALLSSGIFFPTAYSHDGLPRKSKQPFCWK
jgi:hypothetical protein